MLLIKAALAWSTPPPAQLHVFSNGSAYYPTSEHTVSHHRVLQIDLNPGRLNPQQVHEVAVDSTRSKVYVSLLSTSQLFELDLTPTGELNPQINRFTFNSPGSGLHNVAPSQCHPGSLWVATQYDNQVHLVDPSHGYAPAKLSVRVPRLLHNGSAWQLRLSEPHSVREAPDCSIWVALKGETRNVPAGTDDVDFTEVYNAMTVLDPSLPRNHSDGHAVWHLVPSEYNASSFPARGGVLHPALPTPVMSAVDGKGNSFHAQDCSPSVMRIDPHGSITQIPVGLWFKSSGPGVVAAPDGSVWVCSLTRDDGLLLRFRPGTVVPDPFEQIGALGRRRTIHLAFATHRLDGSKGNVMYVLTSSLLLNVTSPATEEVVGFLFDDSWDQLVSSKPVLQVALPVQHTAAHRIALAEPAAGASRSLIVTGLVANALFQIIARA